MRLVAFSDGVFAITITLLVLEIKPPADNENLLHDLLALWPSYLAYAVTFLFIGQVWANHHVMFDHIRTADRTVLLLNTLLRMVVAFLPFATSVLAGALRSGDGQHTAVVFYAGRPRDSSILAVAAVVLVHGLRGSDERPRRNFHWHAAHAGWACYVAGRRGWMVNPRFPSTLTAPDLPPSKSPEARRRPVANSYAVPKIALGGQRRSSQTRSYVVVGPNPCSE
jgi:hypothetical protein